MSIIFPYVGTAPIIDIDDRYINKYSTKHNSDNDNWSSDDNKSDAETDDDNSQSIDIVPVFVPMTVVAHAPDLKCASHSFVSVMTTTINTNSSLVEKLYILYNLLCCTTL